MGSGIGQELLGIVLPERCGEESGVHTFGRAEEPRHGGFLISGWKGKRKRNRRMCERD
jgi:hypothetical protein